MWLLCANDDNTHRNGAHHALGLAHIDHAGGLHGEDPSAIHDEGVESGEGVGM